MDAFVINGGKRLRGTVRVHGAKNAALPQLAAALLTDQPVKLSDVPDLVDIRNMTKLLNELGCEVEHDPAASSVTVHSTDDSKCKARYDIVRTMRASVCVLGPLLARRGMAQVSMPGGCNIGDRPVDLHMRGLRALGAKVYLDSGYIVAELPESGRLTGARVFLGGPFGSTVLGTINVMSAAVLAKGRTIIESAACEPEVEDMANLLNAMGANVTGAGTPRVIVEGVDQLHGAKHKVIPDRIEAGTYVAAAAITNGQITIENFPTDALTAVLDRFEYAGVEIEPVKPASGASPSPPRKRGTRKKNNQGTLDDARMRQTVRVASTRRLEPTQVVTQPHPGFPTDLQAQIMALLCLADGNSMITEKIFPDRFLHVAELLRMGANLVRNGPTVLVSGVRELIGAQVMASDLRASAGLILAGLAARGTTTVHRVYHVDRGYERMDLSLQKLGADVERVDQPAE